MAEEFLAWLAVGPGGRWLDVGCGTGALATTILKLAEPTHLEGIDPSTAYVAHVAANVTDDRARFQVGEAEELPFDDGSCDAVVSGLVLNFVPSAAHALTEMRRVTRRTGTIAAYVWDYAGEMQLMRCFWDAAMALDPTAVNLDEGRRFPSVNPRR